MFSPKAKDEKTEKMEDDKLVLPAKALGEQLINNAITNKSKSLT